MAIVFCIYRLWCLLQRQLRNVVAIDQLAVIPEVERGTENTIYTSAADSENNYTSNITFAKPLQEESFCVSKSQLPL